MNQSEVTRIATRILLLAGLVGINAFPFFTNTATSLEIIFFALSAIHAELCLLTAWCVFVESRLRYSRVFWSLLGTIAAIISATRLLPGQWTSSRPWLSILLGLEATLPAILPMLAVFASQKYWAGTELVADSKTDGNHASFRLKQLFILIGTCAFLSLLLRLVIKFPDGWLASPVDPSDAVTIALAVVQSFVIGLLAAPCALVILKPNRFCIVWLIYFVAVAAVQPILEQSFLHVFERKLGLTFNSWIWPESYWSVIFDNLTWYGPQLLPTVVLFVVLRLTGVRVQDTK